MFRVVPTLMLILISGVVVAAHEIEEKPPESVSIQESAEESTQKIVIPDYVTPLQSFQKYVESAEPEWKAANDLVGEIGGWRAYAREAYLAERQEREALEKAIEQNESKQLEGNNSEGADGESKDENKKTPDGESE